MSDARLWMMGSGYRGSEANAVEIDGPHWSTSPYRAVGLANFSHHRESHDRYRNVFIPCQIPLSGILHAELLCVQFCLKSVRSSSRRTFSRGNSQFFYPRLWMILHPEYLASVYSRAVGLLVVYIFFPVSSAKITKRAKIIGRNVYLESRKQSLRSFG